MHGVQKLKVVSETLTEWMPLYFILSMRRTTLIIFIGDFLRIVIQIKFFKQFSTLSFCKQSVIGHTTSCIIITTQVMYNIVKISNCKQYSVDIHFVCYTKPGDYKLSGNSSFRKYIIQIQTHFVAIVCVTYHKISTTIKTDLQIVAQKEDKLDQR